MGTTDFTRRQVLRTSAGATAAGAVGVLAACGPFGSPESRETLTAREVTVTHWLAGNPGKAHQPLIEERAEELRTKLGVRLTLESAGGGDEAAEKIIIATAGGSPPNSAGIAYWDGARLFAPGISVDPDEELKRVKEWAAQRKDFFPAMLETLLWRGKLTAIPTDTNVRAIYYDKAVLAKAGVAAPTPNWTRDEFTDKAIKAAAPPDRWGFTFSPESIDYLIFFGAAGGKLMNADHTKWQVDNDIGRETLRYLHNLVYARQVVPAPPPGELMRRGEGKVAFDLSLNARLPVMRQAGVDVGAAPIPVHRARYSMSHGFAVAVLKAPDGDAQHAAARFAMWLSAPEMQVPSILKFAGMPVSKAAVEHRDYQAVLAQEPVLKVFADSMPHTYRIPTLPSGRKAEQELEIYLGRAFRNEISINEALAQGQRAAQLILDDDLKVGAR